ncbi:MAG: Lrp/AsnC family transcriptional regulator [Proteobacteria bacterium]|nr:Lrp/AsnC family transcriptional regulator [Pseudomonadota bacterium]
MNKVLESHLLNDYQRDFPLESHPFATIAARLGVGQSEVLQVLNDLQQQGTISRVGAVFRPRSIGFSTLAALAVADGKLEEVAQMVSSYTEVNHNYQREHHYNLWFVAATPTEAGLQRVLNEIEQRSGSKVLVLPLVEDYHIDLGFDMTGCKTKSATFIESHTGVPSQPYLPGEQENRLIAAIQSGLPLVERPFSAVGNALGQSETEVIDGIENLIRLGVIKRIGVIVRHHELGYRANAMVVWDIADDEVRRQGSCLGQLEFVTLCYRRPRRLPDWRYNLFCMIHGHDREEVMARVDEMRQGCGLQNTAYEVLFSTRRFKQCGARYARAAV